MTSSRQPRGLTLISVMIGFVLVGIIVVSVMKAFGAHFMLAGQVRDRVRANDILVSSANALLKLSMDNILQICQNHQVLGDVVKPGLCLNSTGVLAGYTGSDYHTSEVVPLKFDALLDWNGNLFTGTPAENLNICLEVARCQWRASGHLLEVTLRALWNYQPKTLTKVLVVRRTRW